MTEHMSYHPTRPKKTLKIPTSRRGRKTFKAADTAALILGDNADHIEGATPERIPHGRVFIW